MVKNDCNKRRQCHKSSHSMKPNGYCGNSKSINAINAERSYFYPITSAEKFIRAQLAQKGFKITHQRAKELCLEYGTNEWHHTSKYRNRTKYYDTKSIINKYIEANK